MSALTHCPACGHCLRDAEALAERVAALRASLRADGHVVTPDGYVRVDALCALFGFSWATNHASVGEVAAWSSITPCSCGTPPMSGRGVHRAAAAGPPHPRVG